MTPSPADITRVAEALSDYLTQLGVTPDERPEHGGETTAECLARVAINALYRDGTFRAAFKALVVACGRSAQHRDTTQEERQSWGGLAEPTIVTVDHGPTPDAATCQRALRLARPLWDTFGLTKAELDAAYYKSISHP